jgi:putative membrane protein
MKTNLLLIAAAFAGLQACSDGNDRTSDDNPAMDTASITVQPAAPTTAQADTAFAHKAAVGGMAEVELGKMAAEKGNDPKVKDFGNMMVTDHGKANDELKRIAASKNMELPAALDAKHQQLSDSLGKLSGKAFDRAYVNAMVEGHQQTLELLQSEAANGTDADLKAFAAKTAPVVQMHLTKIQQVQNGLK